MARNLWTTSLLLLDNRALVASAKANLCVSIKCNYDINDCRVANRLEDCFSCPAEYPYPNVKGRVHQLAPAQKRQDQRCECCTSSPSCPLTKQLTGYVTPGPVGVCPTSAPYKDGDANCCGVCVGSDRHVYPHHCGGNCQMYPCGDEGWYADAWKLYDRLDGIWVFSTFTLDELPICQLHYLAQWLLFSWTAARLSSLITEIRRAPEHIVVWLLDFLQPHVLAIPVYVGGVYYTLLALASPTADARFIYGRVAFIFLLVALYFISAHVVVLIEDRLPRIASHWELVAFPGSGGELGLRGLPVLASVAAAIALSVSSYLLHLLVCVLYSAYSPACGVYAMQQVWDEFELAVDGAIIWALCVGWLFIIVKVEDFLNGDDDHGQAQQPNVDAGQQGAGQQGAGQQGSGQKGAGQKGAGQKGSRGRRSQSRGGRSQSGRRTASASRTSTGTSVGGSSQSGITSVGTASERGRGSRSSKPGRGSACRSDAEDTSSSVSASRHPRAAKAAGAATTAHENDELLAAALAAAELPRAGSADGDAAANPAELPAAVAAAAGHHLNTRLNLQRAVGYCKS